MKNSEAGPLIIVTLGTVLIVGAFIWSAKKGEQKEGGWKLPEPIDIPPPPQQQPGTVTKSGITYGPGCVWVRVVNAGAFAPQATIEAAAVAERQAPDGRADVAIREMLRGMLACVSTTMIIHDVDGHFSVNALLNAIGNKTIAQVVADNSLGDHPANSVLGIIEAALQSVQSNAIS